MAISVFDLFKIGIGPSSSHTVGPMRAARQFAQALAQQQLLAQVDRVRADMYGSLGATGPGHGTPKAVILGLLGETPEQVAIEQVAELLHRVHSQNRLELLGRHAITFKRNRDLLLHKDKTLDYHANGMEFRAYDNSDKLLLSKTYYSVGGGFIVGEQTAEQDQISKDPRPEQTKFDSAAELLAQCERQKMSIADIMWHNEAAWRQQADTAAGLLKIWQVMQQCVNNGLQQEGELPGGLKVKRRAKALHQQLLQRPEAALADPLSALDWVSLYALAVNEENAAGGRMVTAPT
ncbi:MAG: L-serine ammonia-lyase, partial [Cellvibrionaceae bacterium]|nr:L-serine ammonia-lyase [Cellvibrionaceae bacterium]